MNLLMTGASGFLGHHLLAELIKHYRITTLGRQAGADQTAIHRHITCDLAEQTPDLPAEPFDLVVHAAGKAHTVPRYLAEHIEYERVNVQGTSRLLLALEQLPTPPDAFVYISTVMVYGRQEGQFLTELTPLDATDTYGASKVRAEELVRNWGQQTGVRTTILRLPLVVAREPNGNLALMKQAIERGYYVRIGTGLVRRSMVRADDVAAILLRAAARGGTFNLTDGHHPYVRDIEAALARQAGRTTLPTVPLGLVRPLARVGDALGSLLGRRFPFDSMVLQKLTNSLTFSDEAARQQLNWNPRPVLDLFA